MVKTAEKLICEAIESESEKRNAFGRLELWEKYEQGNLREVERLLDGGENPNARIYKSEPKTFFQGVMEYPLIGDVGVIEKMLDHGADISKWPRMLATMIMDRRDMGLFKELFELNPINLNSSEEVNSLFSFAAFAFCNVEALKFLLENGLELNPDEKGRMPWEYLAFSIERKPKNIPKFVMNLEASGLKYVAEKIKSDPKLNKYLKTK